MSPATLIKLITWRDILFKESECFFNVVI